MIEPTDYDTLEPFKSTRELKEAMQILCKAEMIEITDDADFQFTMEGVCLAQITTGIGDASEAADEEELQLSEQGEALGLLAARVYKYIPVQLPESMKEENDGRRFIP